MQAVLVHGEPMMIDHTPDADVSAGQVIVAGAHLLIAHLAIYAGKLGALSVGPAVYRMVKANEQLNQYGLVYWDADGNPYNGVAGTGAVTATSAGNTVAGLVLEAAAATDETALVFLFNAPSVTNTIRESLSAAIADPGNAGAIPVLNSGSVDIVTAGAETRTLAAPTFRGQLLSIGMKTDGGDCVITCATLVNATGNNTITLNDAGDVVLLQAKVNGANLRWSVVANDGAALSTV